MSKLIVKFTVLLLLPLILAVVSFKTTRAQGVEVEPNNSCETAQDLGTITMPFTLDGELDIATTAGDIDFYQIRATPGEHLEITLSGVDTGGGTLSDPFLGAFNIDCYGLSMGDDYNGSHDSRITIVVPRSGILILAATSCCDYQFVGNQGASGTYQLHVNQLAVIGSIQGRLVDEATGDPVMGSITLNRCYGSDCPILIRSDYTDENGRFSINPISNYDEPIVAGDFQITAYNNFYETLLTERFTVAANQNLDLGDLPLISLPLIGSISGQLIDAATGEPIVNSQYYYNSSQATLYRCNEFDCGEFVGSTWLDVDARFEFNNPYDYATPLSAGNYRVGLDAITYESHITDVFSVGVGEALDLGELEMTPLPRARSITGQIIDASTKSPLAGQNYPYAHVELQKCITLDDCYDTINNQYVGDDGSFVIDTAYFGLPLLADSYQLVITAYEHQTKIIPVDLAEGEALNLGQIRLDPEPVKLTNLQPCQDIPLRGGRCRFSIEITNRMTARLNGLVWAVVTSQDSGSFLNYTTFEIKNAQKVNLQSGRNKKVQFQVDVPAGAGGSICVDIFVAQGTNTPFNTLGQTQFCVYKQSNAY
ncbi:MAG: carboxypeptidase regulatory-like domain-containing protein [Chloroflexota bacterium]